MKYPSINDALERAEIRAQELPHIIQVNESDWDVVVLANEVKRLRREVDKRTPKKSTQPLKIYPSNPYVIPPTPIDDFMYSQCKVCGMLFNGPMGYCCPRSDCPTGVTCNTSIKDKFVD